MNSVSLMLMMKIQVCASRLLYRILLYLQLIQQVLPIFFQSRFRLQHNLNSMQGPEAF